MSRFVPTFPVECLLGGLVRFRASRRVGDAEAPSSAKTPVPSFRPPEARR